MAKAELVAVIKAQDNASPIFEGIQTKVQGLKGLMRTSGVAATAAGGVIVGGLSLALKSAADFEAGMREVNSLMLLAEDEFESFGDEVLDLSKRLGVDAVEASEALYQAISAGVPKDSAIEFLEIASKAAIAGVTDTETAVDGLSTVLNAFGMGSDQTGRIADIMFATVRGGKTTLDELSSSLFNVAPIAAASNIAFEQVAGALATMTQQGVPTSQATTQLRQAMVALNRPTDAMKMAIEELGYETGQAMLEELGFAKTLDILRGYTEGDNEALMKMFGSVEAGGAVLALTGDKAEAFSQSIETMYGSAGAATDAFNAVNEGAARQFEALQAKVNATAVAIGLQLLPAITPLIEKVSEVATKVGDWMEENPELTQQIIIASAAIGGLLLVLGPLLIMLPTIVAALPLLGAAFAAMFGPVGIAIAAIAGLIAVGILVVKNWESIKIFFTNLWNYLVDFFKENWQLILTILFPFMALPFLIIANWDKVREGVETVWGAILGIIETSVKGIIDWINKMIDVLNKIPGINISKMQWGGFGEGAESAITPFLDKVSEVATKVGGWEETAGVWKHDQLITSLQKGSAVQGAISQTVLEAERFRAALPTNVSPVALSTLESDRFRDSGKVALIPKYSEQLSRATRSSAEFERIHEDADVIDKVIEQGKQVRDYRHLAVTVNVAGSVQAEHDLAATVREEILRIKGRNFNSGFEHPIQ